MVTVLAFLFVIGVLVVLHEAGHFLLARLVGAPCEVFSVGFGKRLWGFERGGTDYRISLIPFGGYVRIVGLGPDETDVTTGGSDDEEEPELLPRWKRGVILFGGPIANVLAAVAFLAVAFLIGAEVPQYRSQPPVVGWVEPGSPGAAAGVEVGDHVLTVDGESMATWQDLETAVSAAGGREVDLSIERDGRTIDVALTPDKVTRYEFGYSGLLPPLSSKIIRLIPGAPAEKAGLEPGDVITAVEGRPVDQFYDLIRLLGPRADEETTITYERNGASDTVTLKPADDGGKGKIGIALVFPTEMQRLGPVAAVSASIEENRRMTRLTFKVLGRLVTGNASLRQVSGPLDIARISGEAAKAGIHSLIWFMGVISLQLGIFNLLPIPVLDGGHLTILAFESAMRRDLSIRLKERILEVGFIALILLMVVVVFNDIVKWIPDSVYQFFSRG